MKKFFMITLLIFLLSNTAFGAVSQDMEVYVRKDVFEARMDRLEAIITGQMTQLYTKLHDEIQDVKTRLEVLAGRVENVESRISTLETVVYWILGMITVVLAILTLTPILRDLRKPQITLEDVKKLIEENNMKFNLNGRLQA